MHNPHFPSQPRKSIDAGAGGPSIARTTSVTEEVEEEEEEAQVDTSVTCFPRSTSGLFPPSNVLVNEDVFDDPKYRLFRRAMLETFQLQADYPLLMQPDVLGLVMDEF
ncbi:hypothetical protein HKX48_004712 [Thoreauomyces humboldtii]|nr:hypothetical protein HKX48_004712 [Thoreauomyces humboldtii]